MCRIKFLPVGNVPMYTSVCACQTVHAHNSVVLPVKKIGRQVVS